MPLKILYRNFGTLNVLKRDVNDIENYINSLTVFYCILRLYVDTKYTLKLYVDINVLREYLQKFTIYSCFITRMKTQVCLLGFP